MDQLGDYLSVLETLHRKVNSGQLARCVLRQAVESRTPPEFLYASGSPGRYNSKGTECIYWAEDEKTARAEYRKYELGSATYETFFCKYRLGVLDLGNIKVLSALGLTESDLYADWRIASEPTKTQILGLAVSRQQRFAAIRFPSDAARLQGEEGFNLVISDKAFVLPTGSRSLQIQDYRNRDGLNGFSFEKKTRLRPIRSAAPKARVTANSRRWTP